MRCYHHKLAATTLKLCANPNRPCKRLFKTSSKRFSVSKSLSEPNLPKPRVLLIAAQSRDYFYEQTEDSSLVRSTSVRYRVGEIVLVGGIETCPRIRVASLVPHQAIRSPVLLKVHWLSLFASANELS